MSLYTHYAFSAFFHGIYGMLTEMSNPFVIQLVYAIVVNYMQQILKWKIEKIAIHMQNGNKICIP